jgi:Uri superfamily endonuclease
VNQGIYNLILNLDLARNLHVGSLGTIRFEKGYYSYTGSALGSGGLKRVERHKRVILGQNQTRKWHIDHLLPHTSLEMAVITQTRIDLECQIARKIGEKLQVIPRFGSTDCRCPGHLHYSKDLQTIIDVVKQSHGQ